MERNRFRPRSIDRAAFAILGMLHVANGVYLIGPWYLDETESGKAPLISMFNSDIAVTLYGVLLLVDGLALIYASAGSSVRQLYTSVLSGALFSGFLIRLYTLIGVFLTVDSWRPPSYLSHVATVSLLVVYWLWVRAHARTVQ